MAQVAEQKKGWVEVSADPGKDQTAKIFLHGVLSSDTTGQIWDDLIAYSKVNRPKNVVVDAAGVTYCDGYGVGILIDLKRRLEPAGGTVEINNLAAEFEPLFELFNSENYTDSINSTQEKQPLTDQVGKSVYGIWSDLIAQLAFIGETLVNLIWACKNPHKVRWKDTWRAAEVAGVDALPIVVLIGFLVGFIMAFQSAVPMAQFGTEIFIANLVSLTVLRELGPLMTAIVLAGRSGTAFAAEIGTMKVNEEVNALETMGLDPSRFLVIPRIIAAVAMTPFLTIFANAAGLFGGLLVMMNMGFPPITYYNQIVSMTTISDLMTGLSKSFVFGILVAGLGCMHGLKTGQGASAVGVSTTKAVVSTIILVAIADSIFAVIFYYLGV